jgi:hypothetical protein
METYRMGMLPSAALAMTALLVSQGCAQKLTPQQEHAYKAVETCAGERGNQGWTYWVLPNGSIRFEGRADGFGPIQQCLTQKFGYQF